MQALVRVAGGWSRRPSAPRRAYDSKEIRHTRALLGGFGEAAALLRRELTLGFPSRRLQLVLQDLARRRVELPPVSRVDLLAWVEQRIPEQRRALSTLLQELRRERRLRWQGTLPSLWQNQPRRIYQWLAASPPAWGSTPIISPDGMQCVSVEEVDHTVRAFWVEQVWRKHAAVDAAAQWGAFRASPFFPYVPCCEWPASSWTVERVQTTIRALREDAAPGSRGIPINLWKCLPPEYLECVAALLRGVEADGVWPPELLSAYVAMIPKAAGGTRPQDQRPITVLDVVYRVWSKGTIMAWAPVLQGSYLGQAALGFRAQAGTLHIAQLLSDLMALRTRTPSGELRPRPAPLWLVSFDVEKCFPTLPWWAVFGVMEQAGISVPIVRAFRSFYASLRHRFRYGQVEGGEWSMANGLAQGCPASPDLLNMLFEAFRRWAAGQSKGVEIAGVYIASVSFTDDVVLIATSRDELQVLAEGYLRWCDLLGVRVNVQKTQVWSNLGSRQQVTLAGVELETRDTFRVVGIELRVVELEATHVHALPRLSKVALTVERLLALPVPTAITAHLWRSTVLAQALYRCEIRQYPAQGCAWWSL